MKPKPARRLVKLQHPGVSLILAGLTAADFDAFHAARISYSGSTGIGARGMPCPYIATYLDYLVPSLVALGWTEVQLRRQGDRQWIVRRAAPKASPHQRLLARVATLLEQVVAELRLHRLERG